jgi:hypothetical protein
VLAFEQDGWVTSTVGRLRGARIDAAEFIAVRRELARLLDGPIPVRVTFGPADRTAPPMR